ncbi:MAG: hypothetical protein ACQESQ_07650 [Bacteroidota bacterium]
MKSLFSITDEPQGKPHTKVPLEKREQHDEQHPFIPEDSPICFCTRSLGNQTSKRPISMNIAGNTKIISFKNIQKLSLKISIPGLK